MCLPAEANRPLILFSATMACSKPMFLAAQHRYHGETPCDSVGCSRVAYYRAGDRCLCGAHSRKITHRKELPVNPDKEKNLLALLDDRHQRVQRVGVYNKEHGRKGKVVLSKLLMRRQPEHMDGYLKVFPNFRHGHRRDGYGCPALSPMSLGPVHHGQPGLSPAKNIENMHQANKVFREDIDPATGDPTQAFFALQRAMYESETPMRHKPKTFADFKKKEKHGRRPNAPEYSVWRDATGTPQKFTYIESRQFYCTFYERLAKPTYEFRYLQELIREGVNLQIIGYDAYMPEDGDIEKCYLDASRPFGHELVLYTMLVFPAEEYPWKKHCTFALPDE